MQLDMNSIMQLVGLLGSSSDLDGLTSGVKGEDFWANAAPEDYMMMGAKLLQDLEEKNKPPDPNFQPIIPQQSQFSPLMQGMYQPILPGTSREQIIGLLGLPEDVQDEQLNALLGGLL